MENKIINLIEKNKMLNDRGMLENILTSLLNNDGDGLSVNIGDDEIMTFQHPDVGTFEKVIKRKSMLY